MSKKSGSSKSPAPMFGPSKWISKSSGHPTSSAPKPRPAPEPEKPIPGIVHQGVVKGSIER